MSYERSGSLILRSGAVGVVAGLVAATVSMAFGTVLTASPAGAAATSSEVVLKASELDMSYATAPMPDLSVTVSQTQDLVKQGIRISWTGGVAPSGRPQGVDGGNNFLQIFQCWGDDPDNPGHPDRTTCQYGGLQGPASTRDNNVDADKVDPHDEQYTVPGSGFVNPTYTSIPFESVTGETVSSVLTDGQGHKTHDGTVDVNANQFFTQYTTNEVKWAGSGADGTGTVNFEVQTQMESPGLGCGTPKIEGNTVTGAQSCWLVILPRGTADNGENYITKSGLFWDAWQHHIAVKMSFKPLGVRCQIGSAEKPVSGSSLISQAIASWQPGLCLQPNGAAFVVSTGPESDALKAAATTTTSPLALVSQPMSDTTTDPNVYAPVTISGVAVAFSIDRRVRPTNDVPEEIAARNTTPFSNINLTPRLVAKLLTSSYVSALPQGADLSHIGYVSDADRGPNAWNITRDPDFLAVNDVEWQYQDINSPAVADVLIPQGRSDLAQQLWKYVLSDADAVAFLNGDPDPWGMKVNPWFSTNAQVNPSGVGLALPRDNFPKADPVEKASTLEADPVNGTGAVNLVTWRPYTPDFETGAYDVLRGDGLILGEWQKFSTPPKWGKQARSLIGSSKVMALSTAGASAKFQTVNASLRNPAGNFVPPSQDAMTAAVAAMSPTKNSAVVEFNFASDAAKTAANAYPLTMPVYAALNPLKDDATLRATFASFIRYAVQQGQTPGTDIGSLPAGYAPLPASWVDQALAAASAIQAGIKPTKPISLGNVAPYNYSPRVGSGPANSVPTVAPTGNVAGALSSNATPADPSSGPASAAIPIGMATGLCAALGVPFYTRWRRHDV